MNRDEYYAYLRSDEWKVKRNKALYNAQWRCQVPTCNWGHLRSMTDDEIKEFEPDAPRLQVHHLTYERLGRELPDDLLVLCDECHRREHGILDKPMKTRGLRPIGDILGGIL